MVILSVHFNRNPDRHCSWICTKIYYVYIVVVLGF